MDVEAVAEAVPRKAVLIDDAYLRPSPEDVRKSLPPLRRFLRNAPAAKAWFDATFGLSGSAADRGYFEPLLADPLRTLELWNRRAECPESQRLLEEGLADVVADVGPLRLPLVQIETTLVAQGWELVRFGALPGLDVVPANESLVVIDYVLTSETPEDMAAKVDESTQFLQSLVQRALASERGLPLIVLVSSRPGVAKGEAEAFRKAVGLHGGYFHFIRKMNVLQELGQRIDGFTAEVAELESYRRVHLALKDALQTACAVLKADIDGMELQDLAALHVGHLIHEGEPLSDYVGWMLGQALTVKLQESVTLADASAGLPPENHRVLLGHLEPTQGIPKLFSEASTVRTASSQHHKQRTGSRELRFGDIFVGKLTGKGKKVDLTQFRLVLSQTCDLLQKKITNGQVLCAEGQGTEVPNTEVELMRATLRQLEDKGSTLIRLEDGAYYQVLWNEVNLVTIEQTKLKKEQGFSYIGRLNEIYALEVQHNALNKLGRIGVPVKPGYSLVFGAVRLRVWGTKGEHAALAKSRDNKTVTAVLRPTPKKQIAILLSSDIKQWLVEQLGHLQDQLPKELTDVSKELKALMESDGDFRFFCKQVASGALQLGMNQEKDKNGQKEKDLVWQSKLWVELGAATVFPKPIAPAQGARLQIEFDPIS
ncbi:hypothetical protein [Rhodoferax sp.]|uniref:hypothetical protein n=1 Tax=Rhodoferax sp. TaxID=50421 RepID=UPI0028409043|nr:hypothetical protein [Rhodoferax sp.]MDR3371971.1 hypothetical protein [Rhodoferax sp.]